MLSEGVPYICNSAIAIIRHTVDNYRYPIRPIAFIAKLFITIGI